MKGLVVFLLTLAVIISLSFAAANINRLSTKKIEIKEVQIKDESEVLGFSTFTSAVCENKTGAVNCKDEVFVKCNGNISRAEDISGCNGFKVEIPKTLGFATFSGDWKDPRN